MKVIFVNLVISIVIYIVYANASSLNSSFLPHSCLVVSYFACKYYVLFIFTTLYESLSLIVKRKWKNKLTILKYLSRRMLSQYLPRWAKYYIWKLFDVICCLIFYWLVLLADIQLLSLQHTEALKLNSYRT